jgi:hypothetical protein
MNIACNVAQSMKNNSTELILGWHEEKSASEANGEFFWCKGQTRPEPSKAAKDYRFKDSKDTFVLQRLDFRKNQLKSK